MKWRIGRIIADPASSALSEKVHANTLVRNAALAPSSHRHMAKTRSKSLFARELPPAICLQA